MKEILARIFAKKDKFDFLRPLFPEVDKNLSAWFRVAFTYTSNAIEGNTLSLAETAQVVEKRLTIGGKSIVEHLEALNHDQAITVVLDMARAKTREEIETADVLEIHKTILQKINDAWAGVFRTLPVRVVGSTIPCPNYVKVPSLVDELTVTIRHSQEHPATIAAYAHLQLAAIHPFVDGNGRTARLLMNLLLLQDNYPLVIIDVKDRKTYIHSIQKALQGDADEYYMFIYKAIEDTLDQYLENMDESTLK